MINAEVTIEPGESLESALRRLRKEVGRSCALAVYRGRVNGFLTKRQRRGQKSARARKRRDKRESAWCAFY